jgi:hypothetical protein
METPLISEFDFTLPRGFVDSSGQVHRQGTMRLATARDELLTGRDRQAQRLPGYGTLVLLSQVIIRLGELRDLTPAQLENLFTQDLAYLREFYNRINQTGMAAIPTRCPACDAEFPVELALAGES